MEPCERLKALREERYETKGEGADAVGVPRPTYYGHENGSRGITPAMGRRYADFYKVNFEWLMTGRGAKKASGKHPLVEIYDLLSPTGQTDAMLYLEFLRNRADLQ